LEPGLLHQVLGRSERGAVERKGGMMAVVVAGGAVSAGADIRVELPPGEPIALTPV
jgi:MOSC domain-containing protein YiiM